MEVVAATGVRPAAPTASTGPVCWQAGGHLEIEEWAEHGRRLGTIGRGAGWWIGDWLAYGNQRFGERYSRASRLTGYDVQTLMNMVYVATCIDVSRRRENLSFSHHAEVAALEPDEQDRWLDHALRERLSVRCLREEIRRERRSAEAACGTQVARSRATSRLGFVCPDCGCQFAGAGSAA